MAVTSNMISTNNPIPMITAVPSVASVLRVVSLRFVAMTTSLFDTVAYYRDSSMPDSSLLLLSQKNKTFFIEAGGSTLL